MLSGTGDRVGREVMYSEGGTAYIYLCYGVHSLFNIVTNKKDVPEAVLDPGHSARQQELNRCSGVQGKHRSIRILGPDRKGIKDPSGIHFSKSGMDLTKKPPELSGQGIWLERGRKKGTARDNHFGTAYRGWICRQGCTSPLPFQDPGIKKVPSR